MRGLDLHPNSCNLRHQLGLRFFVSPSYVVQLIAMGESGRSVN
jgi:hypothetical protein